MGTDPPQGAQRGPPLHERERGAGGGVRRAPGQRPVRPRARALPRVPRAQAGHRLRAHGHAGGELPLPPEAPAPVALQCALQSGTWFIVCWPFACELNMFFCFF